MVDINKRCGSCIYNKKCRNDYQEFVCKSYRDKPIIKIVKKQKEPMTLPNIFVKVNFTAEEINISRFLPNRTDIIAMYNEKKPIIEIAKKHNIKCYEIHLLLLQEKMIISHFQCTRQQLKECAAEISWLLEEKGASVRLTANIMNIACSTLQRYLLFF